MDQQLSLDSLPQQAAVPQSRLTSNSKRTITTTTTPSKYKSPAKSSLTPGKPKTPRTPGGDRFIANRSTTNFGLSSFLLGERQLSNDGLSSNKLENQKLISEHFNIDTNNAKILSFRDRAPAPVESIDKLLQPALNSSSALKSGKKRQIPTNAERILDAPEIMNDYYLNILDWSPSNLMAVCLSAHIYVWNATTGSIDHLMSLNGETYAGSISWMAEADCIAIGTSEGEVQIWDANTRRRIRTMAGHSARVSSLSWNQHIISSGSRAGHINHYDVRSRDHMVSQIATAHSQEVCGLKWSPEKQYLASGGNDNTLNIWQNQEVLCYPNSEPMQTMTLHEAAVKALAWCPWKPNLLASGGGSTDKTIRLWNVTNGECLRTTETVSQVCGLLWSSEHREIISGHGYAKNHLAIWKYPSMMPVIELTGHTQRILALALSPDGETVVSAGADETLRLWKCFASDPKKKKYVAPESSKLLMDFNKLR